LIVLDASALIDFLLPDENSSLAQRVTTAILEDVTIAPPHFRTEVTSGILKAIRRGRFPPANRAEIVAAAEFWVRRTDTGFEPNISSVIYLAEQNGLSAYDASYLWLAMDRSCPLLTVDGPLYRVARKLGIAA
jgi:predicted nucleic acid-binding protein